MTRDEHRAQCIEAMAIAAFGAYSQGDKSAAWECQPESTKRYWINAQTAAFDSLPSAGARVNPIGATEDDIDRVAQALSRRKANEAWKKIPDGYWQTQARVAIVAMSAAGDLTNPPEKKP